jgi:predicted ATPase
LRRKKLEQLRLWNVLLYECARAIRHPSVDNIAALRTAIDAEHQSGTRVSSSLFVSQLAQAELKAGNVTKAEAALREAFALVEDSGERFWLADLHRLSGHVHLNGTTREVARAEACFLKAMEIARSQEARLLELRAATDLAGLWRDIGSRNDSRALLEPILATIEGGKTTRDVRNAHILLENIV